MGIFTAPSTNYENYYEEAAFILTWKVSVYLVFTNFFLTVATWFLTFQIFLITLGAWVMAVTFLVFLKLTGKYKVIGYSYLVATTFLTFSLLHIDYFQFNIVELIFMFMTVFYAFVVFGIQIGLITLALQGFSYINYIFSFMNSEVTLSRRIPYSQTELIAFATCLIIVIFLMAMMLVEYVKLKEKSELKYIQINSDLTGLNKLMQQKTTEKTVMLKEIHHRVKNNLQVISSLLRLQSYEIDEENTRVHFQDAVNRVSAMALIHEKMYQNEDLSKINLKNYIKTLSDELLNSLGHNVPVSIDVESDIELLNTDSLVPLALIINELITNTIKHAFLEQKTGVITVDVKKIDDNYFQLVYADNGVWKTPKRKNSFGLELIASLVDQLEGSMNFSIENGSTYKFILKDL
ncbi:sensor histidine kinase [Crocinitomix catalasitica]|uniref:sensor histidine kinase n=1 Tax=Crocinitomix catalasitica TaxID=184607 RepID=UPI000685BD2A|nr:histidine kinase dimerization/phosphoacceptor domain -containing protein [Crocinitomix catalasitica]